MPLKKYTDEVGGIPNRIDEQSQRSEVKVATEVADITSVEMDFNTTMGESKWTVSEIDLLFSAATARDFTIAKKSVANIVFGRNDRFWMSVEGKVITIVTPPRVFMTQSPSSPRWKPSSMPLFLNFR